MNENWIKLLETVKEDEILEYLKKEFDKNNIKYKIDLEERWEGIRIPKYIGKFVIYVQDTFESKAESILNQYYKNNETIIEEINKVQEFDKTKEDETEKESKKIYKKQRIAIKICLGIVICMVLSVIIAGILA